jgi:7 transmembrane receptor (rhodopsin family)
MSENITSYFEEHPYIELPPFGIIFQIVILSIAIIAALSNFAILVSTVRRKDINPHIMLIISMCVSDFLFSFFTAITIILQLEYRSWTSPSINAVLGCVINNFFSMLLMHTSGLSVLLLAVERYLVILKGWYGHEKWILGWISIQWIYSLSISLVGISSTDNVKLASSLIQCQPNFSSRSGMILGLGIVFCITVIVALAIYLFCYYSIFQFYRRRNTKGDRRIISAKERKLMIRLLTITGVYSALYQPWLISMLYELITGLSCPYWFTNFYAITVHLNPACNPIIHYNLDPSIKSEVDHFFGIKRTFPNIKESEQKNTAEPHAPGDQIDAVIHNPNLRSDQLGTVKLGAIKADQ